MSARRPATKVKPARRTQEERRAATIAKLVAAAIASMQELGYTRTTVQSICDRAGLSHGALFRFFPSVLDVIVAAAEEVGRRHIAEFEQRFASMKGGDPLAVALRLARETCRLRTNAVFYELLVAARTDAKLRAALRPSLKRYRDAIAGGARLVPGVDALPPELFELLLTTVIHTFDGEALARVVLPQPEIEERRIVLLLGLLETLEGAHRLSAPRKMNRGAGVAPASMSILRVAALACLLFSCAPRGPAASCPRDVPRPPSAARDAELPTPTLSATTVATAEPADSPPPPETIVGAGLVPLQRRIDAIVQEAAKVRPTVVTQGEDATSGSSIVTWAAKDGTILKLRSVWNGGCCYAPEVSELVVDGDDLLMETFSVVPRAESASLMRGADPKHPIQLEQLLFRDGKLILWADQQGRAHVDGALDPLRWHERERRSHELAAALRPARP